MKIGFSKRIINPAKSVELWGFAKRKRMADGVLSDLYARVLILSDEKTSFVLISLDVGAIGGAFVDHLKEKIRKKTKIDRENIIISVTHTHSAPALIKLRNAGNPDKRYLGLVQSRILKTVVKATKNQIPAKAGYGVGKLNFGVNRRENEIRNDPHQESGTVDSAVSVVRIDNLDNSPLILLFNYAVHPVTLYADNFKVSADYPGEACKYVENALNCEAMFLQGACADINPKIFGDFEKTKIIGTTLGETVVNIATEIETHAVSSFKFTSRCTKLPLEKPPSIHEITNTIISYKNPYRNELTTFEKTDMQWAWELYTILDKHPEYISQYANHSIGILKLNEFTFIFLPGEIFVETGLRIKKMFSPQQIIVVGYTNDCSFGYLPTGEAHEKGGYEVEEAYKYYGLLRYTSIAEQVIISEIEKLKENC